MAAAKITHQGAMVVNTNVLNEKVIQPVKSRAGSTVQVQ